MNPLRSTVAAIAASTLAISGLHAQTTATTDPVGFVTVNVIAGTGVAKKSTLFSLPLLETDSALAGQVSGVITGVTANTISNSNAGWTAGALSQAATPYLIMITSGTAKGRMFLISSTAANTATTVTVSGTDTAQVSDLTTLGIVVGTDTYRIFSCDTLASFFGTPAQSGVLGGANTKNADTVLITVNGTASIYYYDTAKGRWTKSAFGSPDASNTPLLPYYGLEYQRLGDTALSFVVTGAVPTTQRQVSIKNSGSTVLSQYWPVESTLSTIGIPSGFQNPATDWTSGANAKVADTVLIKTAGTTSTYYYDGTNWRKSAFGSPISDSVVIPVGSSVEISKRGSATGYATLTQAVPYTL